MAKLTLSAVTNISTSAGTINTNSDLIEAALENTLSRDGTSPNNMESDLDMDSNRIINLPYATTASEPITLEQAGGLVLAYPLTEVEETVGVVPENYTYPPGDIRRYGTNTTPGTTDMSAAAQASIDVSDSPVWPPGEYNIGSTDIEITLKGHSPVEGGLKLEASGAILTGTGKLVIDSCKRVEIVGLDMANQDLVFRGCWWSNFSNVRFRSLILGDEAGTSFTSNYWNAFHRCDFQSVVFHEDAPDPSNAFSWYHCTMRGVADQAFTGTAAYAFEFNANENAQAWQFFGGDVSYHTSGVYTTGAGNTEGDVEVTFENTYFDDNLPTPTNRDDARIRTINCHHAAGTVYSGSLSAVTCGTVDLHRGDRSFRLNGGTILNLIPDGDFRTRLGSWAGTNRPIGDDGGAVVTAEDGGFFGTYLNINQAATTSNAVSFRSRALPAAGRVTGVIVLRNADAGSKTIRVGVSGLFGSFTISDTEWTVATITQNTEQVEGGQESVQVLTNDSTAFNVDVAFVSIALGEGGSIFLPTLDDLRAIEHAETWDPGSLNDATQSVTTFTVTGATPGDWVVASLGVNLAGVDLTAYVSASDTVAVKLRNDTGSTVDLGSSTLSIRVYQRFYL